MAELHSISLHAGAAAFQRLLLQLRDKGDADLEAFWNANPDLEGQDGRDYRSMVTLLQTSVAESLNHPREAHREGYARALVLAATILHDSPHSFYRSA